MALGFVSPASGTCLHLLLLGQMAAPTLFTVEDGHSDRCLPSVQAALAAGSHGWQGGKGLKSSPALFTHLSIRHRLGCGEGERLWCVVCAELTAWEKNSPDFRASLSTLK